MPPGNVDASAARTIDFRAWSRGNHSKFAQQTTAFDELSKPPLCLIYLSGFRCAVIFAPSLRKPAKSSY
jgi:hypothetical protein